jgi:CRP-like cAMP-binding protein
VSTTTLHRISGLDLFKGCRRSNLRRIDELGTAVALHAGRSVCFEDEPGSEFFLLLAGAVEVRRSAQHLSRLHSGAWFGETALIHHTNRQASVTTEKDSFVIVFSRREFTTLCSESPVVRERLEHTAALYLRGEEPMAEQWYEPARWFATTAPAIKTR